MKALPKIAPAAAPSTAPSAEPLGSEAATKPSLFRTVCLAAAVFCGEARLGSAQEPLPEPLAPTPASTTPLVRPKKPLEAVPWQELKDLADYLPKECQSEKYLYRVVPSYFVKADDRQRIVIEYKDKMDPRPIGYWVTDCFQGQWCRVESHVYPQDIYERLRAESPRSKIFNLDPDSRNYTLFESDTKNAFQRQIHEAQSADTILRIMKGVNPKLLFKDGSEQVRRAITFDLIAACSQDLQCIAALTGWCRASKIDEALYASLISQVRDGVTAIREGRVALLVKHLGPECSVEQEANTREDSLEVTYRIHGATRDTIKLRMSMNLHRELSCVGGSIDTLAGHTIDFSNEVSSSRVSSDAVTHALESAVSARSREIGKLDWQVLEGTPNAPVGIPVDAFTPELSSIIAGKKVLWRSIPPELLHANDSGARVYEFAVLGAEITLIGAVIVRDTDFLIATFTPFNVDAFEACRKEIGELPFDLVESEQALKGLSPALLNYGLLRDSTEPSRAIANGLATANTATELARKLKCCGGLIALGEIQKFERPLSDETREMISHFYDLELTVEQEDLLPRLLIDQGMGSEAAEEVVYHVRKGRELRRSIESITKELSLPKGSSITLLPQSQGPCFLLSWTAPASKEGEPERTSIAVFTSIDDIGKLVIHAVQRNGVDVGPQFFDVSRTLDQDQLQSAFRNALPETPEATVCIDNMTRHFGIPRSDVVELLSGQSRNFVGEYDTSGTLALADFLDDISTEWARAAEIGEALGYIRVVDGTPYWTSDSLDRADFYKMGALLHLANEPLVPRILKHLNSSDIPLNYSVEPVRTSLELPRDTSLLLLTAARLREAGYTADASEDLTPDSEQEFSATLRATIGMIVQQREEAFASSPELRPDGTAREIRVVVVYDATLDAHARHSVMDLTTVFGPPGKRARYDLLCTDKYKKDELQEAVARAVDEATKDDQQVLLVSIVHGSDEEEGTHVKLADSSLQLSPEEFRLWLDPDAKTFVASTSCYGGTNYRPGSTVATNLATPARPAMRNFANTTTQTVAPIVIEANLAAILREGFGTAPRPFRTSDGGVEYRDVAKADFTGDGRVTLTEAFAFVADNSPGQVGRLWGPGGKRLSNSTHRVDSKIKPASANDAKPQGAIKPALWESEK